MCAGCIQNIEVAASSGLLSIQFLRTCLRAALPNPPPFARKVTDDEVAVFLLSLQPAVDPRTERAVADRAAGACPATASAP